MQKKVELLKVLNNKLQTRKGGNKMRRKVVAGNWKMNMLPNEAIDFIEKLTPVAKNSKAEVILCMPYTHINGFGVFRSRLCFKIRVKNPFLFYSDTNFNGGNKTPTPSRKGFFGQSPHLRFASGSIPLKRVVLFILRH